MFRLRVQRKKHSYDAQNKTNHWKDTAQETSKIDHRQTDNSQYQSRLSLTSKWTRKIFLRNIASDLIWICL